MPWDCRYHVVIVPKYRKKLLFGRIRGQIGPILREFFFNIAQCAESFPRGCEKKGLSVSFPVGGVTEDDNVERRTPGFTPDGDSPPQRVRFP